jgi:cell division protein FtsI/penicillin-binding protein 2
MRALLAKDRGVRTSIDIRLQTRVFELLRKRLEPDGKKGAVVVIDPENGDVLALASFPSVTPGTAGTPEELLDRARYGQYPPGSTFKLVTAIAALRLDPDLKNQRYRCLRLRDGRVGAVVKGWNRPIRDDASDSAHGRSTWSSA